MKVKQEYPWGDFLTARARMIRYFRDVDHLEWEEIAEKLSCDPLGVSLVYQGNRGRALKREK